MGRIKEHIILQAKPGREVSFSFDGKALKAPEGEMLSSALIANGIHVFSHHHKDKSPQGIFCANGQCAQCTLLVDGLPVKSCITPVKEGMKAQTLKGLPELKDCAPAYEAGSVEKAEPDVLIIGGGPAGLTAAIELGEAGASVILVDDKHRLGGKLVLQTHKFFGSVEDCYAGTRGIDIATKLEEELARHPSVKVWLNSVAVAAFSDHMIGIVKDNGSYCLVKPRALLIAAGAREKSLPFAGCTLPGVYGAGAFQTLVNRDLVAPCKRLFILGGGNVGLIAAYHAMQAGIKVIGLAEALPEVGGYKVHADKIKRLGVPVYTSHTVLSANGKDGLESVTIAEIEKSSFRPIKGTEKTFDADTLLVAVGLNPCSELYEQAKAFGMNVFAAGDAQEIAEASAAMFSGRIAGRDIARNIGLSSAPAPEEWKLKLEVLKSRPGKTHPVSTPEQEHGVFPVFHCRQEIPCNPCVSVCPKKSIRLHGEAITNLPSFTGECIACGRCVAICPGLAATLVDFRQDANFPAVTLPFEIGRGILKKGQFVKVTDSEGREQANAEITDIKDIKASNTLLVTVKVDKAIAKKVAGITLEEWEKPQLWDEKLNPGADDSTVVCRCERVTLGEIRKAIRSGIRDMNHLKAVTRAGMGACGGKTCESIILSVFRSEGIKPEEVTRNTRRPLVMETTLGQFCNCTPAKKGGTQIDHGGF